MITEQERTKMRNQFMDETETPVVNSQGEIDIDYVQWLEDRVGAVNKFCGGERRNMLIKFNNTLTKYGDKIPSDTRIEWNKLLEKLINDL